MCEHNAGVCECLFQKCTYVQFTHCGINKTSHTRNEGIKHILRKGWILWDPSYVYEDTGMS